MDLVPLVRVYTSAVYLIFCLGRNFKCTKSQLIIVYKNLSEMVALEVLEITPPPENGPSTLVYTCIKGTRPKKMLDHEK